MRKILNESKNFTKKDFINSKNGVALNDVVNGGKIDMELKSVATLQVDDEENGGTKEAGVLITTDGDVYTCISKTVIESLEEIIDLETDGDEAAPFKVTITGRKSKGGREFLTLILK